MTSLVRTFPDPVIVSGYDQSYNDMSFAWGILWIYRSLIDSIKFIEVKQWSALTCIETKTQRIFKVENLNHYLLFECSKRLITWPTGACARDYVNTSTASVPITAPVARGVEWRCQYRFNCYSICRETLSKHKMVIGN